MESLQKTNTTIGFSQKASVLRNPLFIVDYQGIHLIRISFILLDTTRM